MAKKIKIHVGIEKDLQEVTTRIPSDRPKPWDGKDQFNHIGKEVPRVDGKAKTSGGAKYTFDLQLPGMIHAKFLRSPYPAALVKRVDSSKAARHPGVKAILLAKPQVPFQVRYAGDEVLAVAANTLHQAEEALKLIEVEYEELPFVVDLDKALDPKGPMVFGSGKRLGRTGNTMNPRTNLRGPSKEKVEEGLKNCAQVVSKTYRTQVQTHSCLEPHGVVARWEGDQLTLWISTQAIFRVQQALAKKLGLPTSKLRVICEFMGGGFGSKLGSEIYAYMAAKLAKETGTPVKLIYDRKEEHLAAGNRPSSKQQIDLGANQKGKLQALKLICHGSSGTGSGGASMVSRPAHYIYDCPLVYTEEIDVFTHGGAGKPFRAPGHPQGVFALDQAMDEMAYKLGMDPLELRKINTSHPVRLEEYKVGAEKFGWKNRKPKVAADSGPIKKGVGMANSLWYYFYGRGFQVTIQVGQDGSVELTNGVQDIGTGIRTVLAQVAAEELGLKPTDIHTSIGDSNYGLGPASGGSQTTGGVSPAARDAAYLARQKMFGIAAPLLKASPQDLSIKDGKIFVTKNPSQNLTWKQVASKIPGGKFQVVGERIVDHRTVKLVTAGVQFAEVEVDTETGVIRVLRIVAVHDCGQPINTLTLKNQVYGGIIQGVSYALFEDRILDRNTGQMVNPDLEYYKIAGPLDTPEIESHILKVYHGQSSTGAIGIGEPTTVPTAAAIANAVYHATGARVRQLPMTPDLVLKALSAKGGKR